MPKAAANILSTDADFLAAERGIAELRAERQALSPSIKTVGDEQRLDKPLSDRMWALHDQITLSPPVSLVSVAVKLRLLADPDLGLENNEGINDVDSLRQALGLVERVAAGDDEILTLFREWCEVEREADAEAEKIDPAGGIDADRDYNAVLDRADEIEGRLLDIPANSLIGVVIKGFFVAIIARIDEGRPDDPCGAVGSFGPDDYNSTGELWRGANTVRSFALDAVRCLPELAPLVAGIVDAPARLPPSTEGEGSR